MLIFISIIYAILHLSIAMYDFSFYRIPNVLLGALFMLYVLCIPFMMETEAILISFGVFLVVLALGFGLFALKYFGAGDAKYLAVASLWIGGGQEIIQFILTVTVMGGGLAIVYLLLKDHMARLSDIVWARIQKVETKYPFLQYVWVGSGDGAERGRRENISSRAIPYGVAIASGALIMMKLKPLLL
jgi:prepilin peptidase CpaA